MVTFLSQQIFKFIDNVNFFILIYYNTLFILITPFCNPLFFCKRIAGRLDLKRMFTAREEKKKIEYGY